MTHGAWGRLWHFMRLAPSKADFKETWQGVDDDGLNCESMLNLEDRLPFKVTFFMIFPCVQGQGDKGVEWRTSNSLAICNLHLKPPYP